MMEDSMAVPQKIKLKLPDDPALPLLGIHPQETSPGSHRGICTSESLAALSTMAKYGNNVSVRQGTNG